MNLYNLLEGFCIGSLVSGLGFAFVILYNLITKTKEEFDKEHTGITICGTLCVTCIVFAGIFAGIIPTFKSIPTAMDVYQGKTEIQYTMKGSVKTDSIIVFKEGYGRD
jgi:hypothetical protein